MKRTVLLVALSMFCTAVMASAQTESPLLARNPSISWDQTAFVYAGDLWVVGREGGDARRLTAGDAPDIEVELDPKAWRQGHDLQLEKAVEVVMEALRRNSPPTPRKPAYPNYHNGRPTVSRQ